MAAILDAIGAERFATYGSSGGGPHALACAALLGDRCAAAATLAGVGPADAPDFDFMAGMGEGNIAEFGAAREGRDALVEFCRADAAGMTEATPEQLADALRPHLSAVDAEALTGELAEHLLQSIVDGLAPGVEGWVDDDFAFLAPWGFDVGAIEVPVLVWQGEEDLMVPAAARGLAARARRRGAGRDAGGRGPPHALHRTAWATSTRGWPNGSARNPSKKSARPDAADPRRRIATRGLAHNPTTACSLTGS